MSLLTPEGVTYGLVVGRWVQIIGDTSVDPDKLPDTIPVKGSILFTRKQKTTARLDTTQTDGTYVGIAKQNVTGYLRTVDGELALAADSEDTGLWLVTGIYTVIFSLSGTTWPSFDIEVTAAHTAEAPLDLISASPYVAPVGATPVVIMVPAGVPDGYLLAKNGTSFTGIDPATLAAPTGSSTSAFYQIPTTAGTITLDPANGDRQAVTLTGNATFTPTGDGTLILAVKPGAYYVAWSGVNWEQTPENPVGVNVYTLVKFGALGWFGFVSAYGVDIANPTAPTGLLLSSITSTGATLSWAAAVDDLGLAHYEVSKDGGATITSSVLVGEAYPREYAFTGLTDGTLYTFAVRAVDLVGKRSTWATIAGATSSTTTTTTTAAGVTPIYAWAFNEASGSTAAPTIGAVSLTLGVGASFAAGHSGNALTTNQVDGGVATATGLTTTSSTWAGLTVACWAKPTESEAQWFFAGGKTSGGNGNDIVGLSTAGGYLYVNGVAVNIPDYTPNAAAGAWRHIAITWTENGTVKGYEDGVLRSESAMTTGKIWRDTGSTNMAHFAALMVPWVLNECSAAGVAVDDLRIYSTELTADQIAAIKEVPVA